MADHVPEVFEGDGADGARIYQAFCEGCGWAGEFQPDRASASHDADSHLNNVEHNASRSSPQE